MRVIPAGWHHRDLGPRTSRDPADATSMVRNKADQQRCHLWSELSAHIRIGADLVVAQKLIELASRSDERDRDDQLGWSIKLTVGQAAGKADTVRLLRCPVAHEAHTRAPRRYPSEDVAKRIGNLPRSWHAAVN